MLKSILLACLCSLLLPVVLHAQSPEVVRSKPFDEPEDGASRLLLMKNGNTLFFHFTRKKGVEVVAYNNKHQDAPLERNRVKSWRQKRMRYAALKGLFEMNGQAVVFLMQYTAKKPLLYRFIFDGNTGKLVKEEVIGELPRVGLGISYGMAFGSVPKPDFYVRKDPESEFYAVAAFNSMAHDRNERIKITHYSPDHKKLNEAFYESPKGTYKYLEFMEMYVHRDEFVFVSSFAYNTRSSGGKDSRVMISRLTKGTKEFEYKLLDYTDDYMKPDVALKYKPVNKTLYMLAAVNAKNVKKPYTMYTSRENLVLQMNVIDPFGLTVKNKYFIDHPALSDYAQDHLKYRKPYYGVVQDFRLNADSTITVMYEELDAEIRHSTSTSYTNGQASTSHQTTVTTTLGDIGVVRINEAGKEMPGSYAIAKSQITNTWLDLYYIYRRPQTSWTFRKGALNSGNYNAGFLSYDYMFANNTGYAIFNDYPRNTEDATENYRKKKGKLKISTANTVLAYHDGNTVKKNYLFGAPESKDVSRFSVLEMNTHSEDPKSYATLMIERHGRKKKAYIVWITF